MSIAAEIANGGTEAVIRYRAISGSLQDNEVPEQFLGSFIAMYLHDKLNLATRIERYYTTVASELGVMRPELISEIGGLEADVALYRDAQPMVLIELKKFQDYTQPGSIVRDANKLGLMTGICNVEAYLGILMTDTATTGGFRDRLERLSRELGSVIDATGPTQRSADGKWEWVFAAVQLPRHRGQTVTSPVEAH